MSQPTDPGAESEPRDTVAAFAADLKALKQLYPRLSYEGMERLLRRRGIDVGRSTLNNAIKPESLATERTVRAFVLALTNDERQAAQWVARRKSLIPKRDETNEPVQPAFEIGSVPRRWWLAAAAAVLVLTASNVATGVLVSSCDTPNRPDVPAAHTGDDAGKTPCRNDAKVAASFNRPQMLLEILFSHTCDSAWGRITRFDNAGRGNRLEVSIYRRSDPHGPTRQDAVEPDVDSAYTFMIVRADPTDRLCATGAITVGDHTEPAGQEICT
ncbi:DUF2690 domain-containing protein [Nocardia sp. NPDC006044]|uniref:DUF2690 domain-containing protein n=1 Tax=Nocardia sp. NPDC006044 TaxID=3364306 RepID=UPI0036A8E3EF